MQRWPNVTEFMHGSTQLILLGSAVGAELGAVGNRLTAAGATCARLLLAAARAEFRPEWYALATLGAE